MHFCTTGHAPENYYFIWIIFLPPYLYALTSGDEVPIQWKEK
jgi:hypothetical protein